MKLLRFSLFIVCLSLSFDAFCLITVICNGSGSSYSCERYSGDGLTSFSYPNYPLFNVIGYTESEGFKNADNDDSTPKNNDAQIPYEIWASKYDFERKNDD